MRPGGRAQTCQQGHTYEREALLEFWATRAAQPIERRYIDPNTNTAMHSDMLIPNWDKRKAVQGFLDAHPAYVPAGWDSRQVPPPAAASVPPQSSSAGTEHRQGHRVVGLWTLMFAGGVILAFLAVPDSQKIARSLFDSGKNSGGILEGASTSTSSKSPQEQEHANRAHRVAPQTMHHPARRATQGTFELGKAPVGSTVKYNVSETSLSLTAPPAGFCMVSIFLVGFVTFWLSFVAVWTAAAYWGGAPWPFVLFSIPFWCAGVFLAKIAFSLIFVSEELILGQQTFSLHTGVLLSSTGDLVNHGYILSSVSGQTVDLVGVDLLRYNHDQSHLGKPYQIGQTSNQVLVLQEGVMEHAFGTNLQQEAELLHVQGVISAWLAHVRGNVSQHPT